MKLYEISRLVTEAKAELADVPARARIGTERKLLMAAEILLAEIDRLQKQNIDLAFWKDQYAELAEDWNTLVTACQDLGIDVSSPFPEHTWQWRTGGASGAATTMGKALAAALAHRLSSKEETVAIDLGVYTFTTGSTIKVEVYDADSPVVLPKYDLTGEVTKIERVNGQTRIYVWRGDTRYILILPGEV
jgi:hypothetical protein